MNAPNHTSHSSQESQGCQWCHHFGNQCVVSQKVTDRLSIRSSNSTPRSTTKRTQILRAHKHSHTDVPSARSTTTRVKTHVHPVVQDTQWASTLETLSRTAQMKVTHAQQGREVRHGDPHRRRRLQVSRSGNFTDGGQTSGRLGWALRGGRVTSPWCRVSSEGQ